MTQTSNEYRLEFNRWGESSAPKSQEKRPTPPPAFGAGVPVDKYVQKNRGGVTGEAGGRVTGEAQTETKGTTSQFNPPNPLCAKGGTAGSEQDKGQDKASGGGARLTRAVNRAERKLLDEASRFTGKPCEVCGDTLPEVAIVELSNGRRLANVAGYTGRWVEGLKGRKIFVASTAVHWHCWPDA